jgi:phosphoenolpyruvate synthase/pyruvate phosphate dikinase
MKGILGLTQANNLKLVGGKAFALSTLVSKEFNVPAGFVITTEVKNLSKGVKDEVLAAFDTLNFQKVAVRSSAALEDGAKDAWAGQMDTFLNVTRANLFEKIKLCQNSANSKRAKAYADQKKIHSGDVAVIVQRMVPAQVSGVAFSAHPVTNDISQMVIESVGGLGEKLVSGIVTPTTYIINKKGSKVIEKYLSNEQALSSEQIENIAVTVAKIEKTFGWPVDVEWSYADNELFILQSRPITTLV